MNLYQIQQDYFNKLSYLMGLDDLTEEIINDTLSYESDECAKAVGAFYKNTEAEIEAMREYEKNMALRRQALEKKNESLKASLLNSMLLIGKNKIPSTEFDIRLKKNRDSVHIDSMTKIEDLPPDCIREKTDKSADKEKIREKLEAGEVVKGCSLKTSYRVEIK